MVHASSTTSSEADLLEVEPDSTMSPSQQLQQLPPGAADGSAIVNNKDEEEGQPPPLRSMSSFRARLRAGRREQAAPVTLFQWETRGHFWSALDKAAAPKDPSQARTGISGLLIRAWQRTKMRAKNTATVVRLHPGVLLWPLLLCGVCLAAGIVGVELGARHYTDISKDEARAAAREAVSSLQLAWARALQPLASLELHVALNPRMAQLGPALNNVSQELLLGGEDFLAPPALLLAPFGVARAATSAAPGWPQAAAQSLLGQPLPTLEPGVSPAVLQNLILQPYSGSGGSGTPSQLLVASRPVFISGVSPSEDWGNGNGPDGRPVTSCAAPACVYLPAADGSGLGTRLWGFTAGLLDPAALTSAWGLRRLQELGYVYRLPLGPNSTSAQSLAVLASTPAPPPRSEVVAVRADLEGAPGVVLQLELAPEEGWHPYWRSPLLAVVVTLSVAMSVMLFAALVLQRRHIMFLEALLPKQVIGVLGTGRTFYQHYDMVTVLYADIVRYSNAPTGMPPWEVVKLLDDVNNIYDSLLDKHGLVKIRRSGEAFMAVGGCPDVGDPVAVAVRVAMCAREMVMATAGFRSSAGQRVQIRLGLHSGPAVAAVLGTHTPRFSLLGDTVDIAYFMESTSTIMGVHVSDTTAELLNIADDPLISLQPRGIIDIKGRGPITTSWLRIDLLAPMGTWNGEHTNGAGGGGAGSETTTKGTAGGAGGGGGGGGAAGRSSQGGGKPAAAPADIACTADLAVAATLGVRGAPLVRKLSQTGLTQTRRALPDRRQREGRVYDNSLLGSFTLRLEAETLSLVRDMLAGPTPPASPSRAALQHGGSTASGDAAVLPMPVPVAVAEGAGQAWDATMADAPVGVASSRGGSASPARIPSPSKSCYCREIEEAEEVSALYGDCKAGGTSRTALAAGQGSGPGAEVTMPGELAATSTAAIGGSAIGTASGEGEGTAGCRSGAVAAACLKIEGG